MEEKLAGLGEVWEREVLLEPAHGSWTEDRSQQEEEFGGTGEWWGVLCNAEIMHIGASHEYFQFRHFFDFVAFSLASH